MSEFNLSYQLSNTFQDNRQPSRENADFKTISHQIALGWQRIPDLSQSWLYLYQCKKASRKTLRASPVVRPLVSLGKCSQANIRIELHRSDEFDSFDQKFSRSATLEALLTWQFNLNVLGRGLPASAFIRYGRHPI
jgi:hypothetical protein